MLMSWNDLSSQCDCMAAKVRPLATKWKPDLNQQIMWSLKRMMRISRLTMEYYKVYEDAKKSD